MSDDTVNLRFGDYVVQTDEDGVPLILGEGGSGITYLARHAGLGLEIALKKIHDRHVFDPDARASFHAQAQAQAQVAHKHLGFAPITDFGDINGACFYAMEWCNGGTVQDYVKRNGPIALEWLIPLVYRLADALGFAHRSGVIHRDVKPSNVLLNFREGSAQMEVKITDFGLEGEGGAAGQIWTPRYASPEQMRGHPEVDQRTDIFSLGLTAWFLL